MDISLIYVILWLSLALVAGLLMSKLMSKIHFPNVTGFLLTGILIGPWVLGFINQGEFNAILTKTSWINDVALGFIAFTIGNSFKASVLKKIGKKATVISIFEALGAAIAVVLVLFIAYFAGLKNHGLTIPMILILGSIACATAPAATLLIINQYKARGPVTETLIPVVAFDDAVALIAFAVLFAIAKTVQLGNSFNIIEAIVIPLAEIILSLVIGALIGLGISFATRWFKSRHNRLILIIAGVLLAIGVSSINTETLFHWTYSFQLSSLLTAMAVGGVYANMAQGTNTTSEYLDKFTSPLFMLFFITSGAKLNFSIFADKQAVLVTVIAAIYLISRVGGKYGGAALGSQITNSEPVVKKYLGFTLIPQAGVALGLAASAQAFFAQLGEEHASIGVLIYTIIIMSTIIYELTGPLITKWALTKAGEITNNG